MSYGVNPPIYHQPYAPSYGYGYGAGLASGVGIADPNLQNVPASDISSGEKLLVGGIVLAVVVGVSWLVYKKVQLYHNIAEKEGSTGVMKLTAADTGSYLAMKAFD